MYCLIISITITFWKGRRDLLPVRTGRLAYHLMHRRFSQHQGTQSPLEHNLQGKVPPRTPETIGPYSFEVPSSQYVSTASLALSATHTFVATSSVSISRSDSAMIVQQEMTGTGISSGLHAQQICYCTHRHIQP